MRRAILFVLLASAACSPSTDQQATSAVANNATAAIDPDLRHAESMNSPAARQAKAVAAHYFALIEAGDFGAARKLWAQDGAASGGSAKDLAAFYANYSSYAAVVGVPTDVHVTDGRQYVNVAIRTRATIARSGKTIEQEGPLMLRRSIDPHAADGQERDWQIWGVDIRVPH